MGCCGKKIKNVEVAQADFSLDIKQRLTKCISCSKNKPGGKRLWCSEHHWYIPDAVKIKSNTCFIGQW